MPTKFNNISFQDYLSKGVNDRFVIILGTGFHKQAATREVNNILSDWNSLLRSINPGYIPTKNYLVDFEQMIIRETLTQTERTAAEIEKELLREIAKKIRVEQDFVLSNHRYEYPIEIFNPKYVSDVISLDFDLVVENLVATRFNTKVGPVRHLKYKKSPKSGTLFQSTRYREIKIDGLAVKEGIRFWHPHGDIEKPESMVLGLRKYGTNIQNAELLRRHSKDRLDNSLEPTVKSWYDRLTHQPVLILGAGLSVLEWDILFALTNRMRNFAKNQNQKFNQPIFKMMNPAERAIGTYEWIKPLFEEDLVFDQQWISIRNLFRE